MDSSPTVVDFHTTVWIEFGGFAILPTGTKVMLDSARPVTEEGYQFLTVTVHCVYDYSPFADATAPAFEFQAVVLRVADDGTLLPLSDPVTCISSPSGDGDRITTIKE
ncbi:hypothetical protein KNT99_gp45 [Gordonia phage NatB6]|uniref:DUF7233 domain-containing protein n=1 Tax=Gordonia phage NatB6 TaxID=2250322 RepID=A0A345L4X3_9CAUD|nr:hypothetical protein KNT99_gp45 [Gordonia phage NatB6]AXH50325.1 hypothetical protein SEA_NATB6_45 [Gordonia phage NatB6]WNM66085.1 hypothetical protein SEA_WHEEZY_45 [Gordonia phage Wheezy]